MTVALVLAMLAIAAPSPRTPVLHFLRPSSPADGCAQLTERYKSSSTVGTGRA
jgi:hypothetical protein